uniref:CAT RNA binding domain-containing protein n=1 Tax=Faecalibacterium prausnitzii TaxID=853 RepID=UPI003FEFC274
MQYTVKKPINNILRVVDPTGCELIVTGRGLGFGVKPGYKIEAETVERSYRMTSPAMQTFRTTRAASLRCTSSTQNPTPP